jgi:N-acetylmuramoyl-L-alanine amidase
MRPALRLVPALAAILASGCVHRGGRPSFDLDELRAAMAACPVPLTDGALDDLATYERCRVPPSVARLVRNDYIDGDLHGPDLSLLQRHAGTIPRSSFEAQLRRFVDPGGVLGAWLELDSERNVLRPDPVLAPGVEIAFAEEAPLPGALPAPRGDGGREHDALTAPRGEGATCSGERCRGRLVPPPRPELPFRPARRAELLAAASAARPLAGLRVGVDPGHSGGPFAALEERRLVMTLDDPSRALVVQEGDLTLRTALELRAKLTALGAEVILTRDRAVLVHRHRLHELRPAAERLLSRIALDPAYAALEGSLAPQERQRLRSALAVLAVRRQSRSESLRWRARLLAGASPDLVVSIHYNAAPPSSRGPLEQDLVVMVRGFHEAARLYNPHDRWRAIEEAFAVADFDASVHLGTLCVRAMADRLGIAPSRDDRYRDQLPILDAAGTRTGVAAWNGALLRSLDGVAILTEGPYMTVREEAERMQAALAAPFGTAGTRIERYADALASCIGEFVGRWTRSERNPFGTDP